MALEESAPRRSSSSFVDLQDGEGRRVSSSEFPDSDRSSVNMEAAMCMLEWARQKKERVAEERQKRVVRRKESIVRRLGQQSELADLEKLAYQAPMWSERMAQILSPSVRFGPRDDSKIDLDYAVGKPARPPAVALPGPTVPEEPNDGGGDDNDNDEGAGEHATPPQTSRQKALDLAIKAKSVMALTIANVCEGQDYRHAEEEGWASQISTAVTALLVNAFPQHKFIVHSVVVPVARTGLHMRAACFWDKEADTSVCVNRIVGGVRCVVMMYAFQQ